MLPEYKAETDSRQLADSASKYGGTERTTSGLKFAGSNFDVVDLLVKNLLIKFQ